MSITTLSATIAVVLFVVVFGWLMNKFFNFSDHADNMDDDGGWK